MNIEWIYFGIVSTVIDIHLIGHMIISSVFLEFAGFIFYCVNVIKYFDIHKGFLYSCYIHTHM